MKLLLRIIICLLFSGSIALSSAKVWSQDDVRVTAYYPQPYAHHDQMQVYSNDL